MSFLFFGLFLSTQVLAQGLLFRQLYRPNSQAELSLLHREALSSWSSPYGDLSQTEASVFSDTLECGENCGYKVLASHRLQRFSKPASFGHSLEKPEFGGLIDFEGENRILLETSINSPSDRPFYSLDETSLQFTAALAPTGNLSQKKEGYWLYFLNYSNTRQFLPHIPLPGFSYIWITKSGWTWGLGAPFFTVNYRNYPKWSFGLQLGPYFYSTQIFYGPPVLQVGISSSWKQDGYFIAERSNREERLFLDEKDVSLHFKHPLSKDLFLEWLASYYFHQEMRFGKSYSRKTSPTEDLGSSVCLTINLKLKLDSFAK